MFLPPFTKRTTNKNNYESQANYRDTMWQTGLQLVLLSTTLENTSTPKEMRTSTSVQVFWMQATDTDFDLFQKRKDKRKLIESLRVLEIEAQWLCGQSNTNVALQMCLGRLVLELLSLSSGHVLKLWTQMTPDTGHCCWHCWSVALRTWSHRNGLHCQRSSIWILASFHLWPCS